MEGLHKMLLSKDLSKTICRTGLYQHEPDPKYHDYQSDDKMYWCYNWTYKPLYVKQRNNWYMVDTYYDVNKIPLDNNNFHEFKLIFDFKDVREATDKDIISDYNESDVYKDIPVDAGGIWKPKTFIKLGATRNKELILKRYRAYAEKLEEQLIYIRSAIKEIIDSDMNEEEGR